MAAKLLESLVQIIAQVQDKKLTKYLVFFILHIILSWLFPILCYGIFKYVSYFVCEHYADFCIVLSLITALVLAFSFLSIKKFVTNTFNRFIIKFGYALLLWFLAICISSAILSYFTPLLNKNADEQAILISKLIKEKKCASLSFFRIEPWANKEREFQFETIRRYQDSIRYKDSLISICQNPPQNPHYYIKADSGYLINQVKIVIRGREYFFALDNIEVDAKFIDSTQEQNTMAWIYYYYVPIERFTDTTNPTSTYSHAFRTENNEVRVTTQESEHIDPITAQFHLDSLNRITITIDNFIHTYEIKRKVIIEKR